METQLKYIGREISLAMVKNLIAEYELGSKNTVVLNPSDFNTVSLEYIHSLDESIPKPLIVDNVTIEKDNEYIIPYGSIGIQQNTN